MPTILLKPCQNMKGQPFAVMLGFCMSFFEFASAACYKKRHAKTEHDNKFLVILILSELYWPLQIFRSSWPTTRVTKSFSVCVGNISRPLDWWVIHPSNPATQRILLKIVGFFLPLQIFKPSWPTARATKSFSVRVGNIPRPLRPLIDSVGNFSQYDWASPCAYLCLSAINQGVYK